MGRPRIYQSESEKNAAYRQRQREGIGGLSYRYDEALKKRAYRARRAGDTGADPDSLVREWEIKKLCDLCVRAVSRMAVKRRRDRNNNDYLSVLLSAMLSELEDGLEKAKLLAPGLRPELDALLDQCRQVRRDHTNILDLACVFADVEDRLLYGLADPPAGRRRRAKPELDNLIWESVTFRDYRAKLNLKRSRKKL